jgi:recombination associated protein RdgC
MWFKNIRLYQLNTPIKYQPEALADELSELAFTPCLPSFAESLGWVAPTGVEEGQLVHAANGYMMICLQIEEKILPAAVIKQELDEKIKVIQAEEDRTVRQKEKMQLKEEIIMTLRPKAFCKRSQIFAVIDTKNNWLLIDSSSAAKVEKFVAFLKKSLQSFNASIPAVKKPAYEMTQWLQHKTVPGHFIIEKACALQDPELQTRTIRCTQQNLFAQSIQDLMKDGCQVIQLALNWNDQVNLVLADDFLIKSIRFHDEILAAAKDDYSETAAQQFDADFILMTEILTNMLLELTEHFYQEQKEEEQAANLETA